jgi:RNA polymerase sigma-70 factor (ECF subfamily)
VPQEERRIDDSLYFRSAFDLYFKKIYLYLLRYCKDGPTAENIAQDTFVSFWENIDSVRRDVTPLPYLYATAKNKAINELKREILKTRHQDYVRQKELQISFRALESSVISDSQIKEINRIVTESLGEMTPKVAEAFRMSRFEGLKNEEIADRLGISVKSVEYRIMSALRVLKKNLKDYLPVLWFLF